MEENLKIELNRLQESIKLIVLDYELDITSLGHHITDALSDVGSSYTFKLITLEEAKKWKEEYQN